MSADFLGRFSAFGRMVRRHRPDTIPVDVFLTPSLATWHYVSHGPYRVIRRESNSVPIEDAAIHAWEDYESLDEACQAIGNAHLPRAEGSMMLIDGRQQIVLGWIDEGKFNWYGTGEAFNALALAYDPLSVAVWETQAKERASLESYGS